MMNDPAASEPTARQRAAYTLFQMARASEWWAYKFAPILATAYATATVVRVPLWPLLPRLLLLLLALTVGATYVSVLNDWTDRADDAAAGKANRLARQSGRVVAAALVGCASVGLAIGAYFWRLSPLAAGLYLGAWVAYSLYSLPPLRLKVRSGWGLLADTAGAHLFPQLLTATLVSQWAGVAPAAPWLGAVGAWALGCGLRNILWHQLGDAANDAQAGVNTFVVRWGAPTGRRLAVAALLLEGAALLGLLYLLRQPLAYLGLGLYGVLTGLRARVWRQPVVIAQPQAGQHILLNEYYEVYYPLALLLAQVWRYPADAGVLALHGLLFGVHSWQRLRLWGRALAVLSGKIRRHHAEGA
ncbi:UbiA family prenyltransferase [Hymenobacter negativus]|uniref:UbiA family prenyltransferase n=1 Tax=Hymenobacter negativus TaxID=2795026 RepID=A0ABS3Q9W7_9BACT|nr:UbiA family prenyltransferase [Hymenobacter negativus]MBO2007778.1 UbiA family prenyltransferase [Hymenobacter negativus]